MKVKQSLIRSPFSMHTIHISPYNIVQEGMIM